MSFKIGEKVLITNDKSKYYGRTATIAREPWRNGSSGMNIGVIPDGAEHIYHYSYGLKRRKYLTLVITSVKRINESKMEVNHMEGLKGFEKVAIITMNNGYGAKNYAYALYDDTIQVGDMVLVTGQAGGHIHKVKEVISVEELKMRERNRKVTEEVMCKVDLSAYSVREHKRKVSIDLCKQLEKKKKEIDARKDEDYYASLDPEYAAMLNELRSLNV